MPRTVPREQVLDLLKQTTALFERLLQTAPPFVITQHSLQLLVRDLGVSLANSWISEKEERLLLRWNRDIDKFRSAWVRAAGESPRIMVNGQQVLLITESATDAALKLCPKGPQDFGE